jgi:dolichyl-phosphate beta-glucosyltransferase
MEISVIIPVYNEETRINCITKVINYLDRRFSEFEIIVSDNGSTDDTVKIAQGFADVDNRIKVLKCKSRGKGLAVREGILSSVGKLVLFTDVDLSTPIEEIDKLIHALEEGYDIVIASRWLPSSQILKRQLRIRETFGRLLNWIIQKVYLPGIFDTQCGFKLFRGGIARELFSEQKIDGFLFDVEILCRARKKGYKICEEPVHWINDESSKVSMIKHFPQIIIDLIRIKYLVG